MNGSISPQKQRFVLAPAAPFSRWQRIARWLGFVVGVAVTSLAFGLVLILWFVLPTIPSFADIGDYQPSLGSRFYSLDGQLIGEFAAERRVWIEPDKIPSKVAQAFMAAEDKRFFRHHGVDMVGIVQALFDKLRKPGSKLRGASTITQQVAKSLLARAETYESATERSLMRKVREALLAMRLERSLSKQQILYMYLTHTFLGHKAYGVQAAAEHYFRKNIWEISLAEMATLAGLPQRPSDYSPISRPSAAAARRRYVLRRMLEDGYITNSEYEPALQEEVRVYPREEMYLQLVPSYTEQARREMLEQFGERALLEEGLQVFTAVNLEHQALAQQAVEQGLIALDKRQGYRGPLATLTRQQHALFRSKYRAELKLADGALPVFLTEELYLALVMGFSEDGQQVQVDVAGQLGTIMLPTMRWARLPNPLERHDLHIIKDARHVLSIGDIIQVRPVSINAILADSSLTGLPKSLPPGPLFLLEQEPIAQGALMAVEPRSGYVTAQVGGYNFDDSAYNRAVQACREPGSAFKPVVYSAAIDKFDYTASTLIDDKPLVYNDMENASRWKPNNAGAEFRGRLPMRTCLKDSINTPAIRIAEAVGIESILLQAQRLGITSPLKRELGTALGSSCTTLFELMHMYTTLNQYGQSKPLYFVRSVADRFGNILLDRSAPWDVTLDTGRQLDRAVAWLRTPKAVALDTQTGFLMTSLLKNVVQSGTAVSASRIGQIAAGKTGTTNDSYDAWFMGYTRHLVTGVWVGHDKKERPLGVNEQGGRTALPIWSQFMANVLLDYRSEPPSKIVHGEFPVPQGVVQVAIDPETGLLARGGSRHVLEYYREGTEPTDVTPDKGQLNPAELDVFNADGP